jgi:hypothetical protein
MAKNNIFFEKSVITQPEVNGDKLRIVQERAVVVRHIRRPKNHIAFRQLYYVVLNGNFQFALQHNVRLKGIMIMPFKKMVAINVKIIEKRYIRHSHTSTARKVNFFLKKEDVFSFFYIIVPNCFEVN